MDRLEVYRKMFAMTRGLRLMMCFPFIVAVFSVVFSFVTLSRFPERSAERCTGSYSSFSQ